MDGKNPGKIGDLKIANTIRCQNSYNQEFYFKNEPPQPKGFNSMDWSVIYYPMLLGFEFWTCPPFDQFDQKGEKPNYI